MKRPLPISIVLAIADEIPTDPRVRVDVRLIFPGHRGESKNEGNNVVLMSAGRQTEALPY